MNVVLETLGSPSETDLSFISDQTALKYLSEFPVYKEGIDFRKRFPYANDDSIDLLKKILQFNPYFRPSIDECLAHPLFKNCRKIEDE